MTWTVFPKTTDVGPTLAPDWRLWSVAVERKVSVEPGQNLDDDLRTEAEFRRAVAAFGLHIVGDVEWEPVCTHDLTGLSDDDAYDHVNDCDTFWLYGRVQIPARDGRHAYEQVCRALKVEPKPQERTVA